MNFDLFKHTILLTRAGSRAYGMHTPNSDLDVKGVAIPPVEYTLGLDRFEQADKASHFQDERFLGLLTDDEKTIVQGSKLEGSIYDLKKFLNLALDNNPNMLDALFCDDKDVLLATDEGKLLRANRDGFLSAKCKFTFSGYAISQAKRINLHRRWLLRPPDHKPTRGEFDLPEHTLIPADQLAAAEAMVRKKLDEWQFDFSLIEDDASRMELTDQITATVSEVIAGIQTEANEQDVKWRAAVRAVGLDDNLLLVMEKERKYKASKVEWDNYQRWKKTRNPDRAALEEKYGFDSKHGAHLVRLLKMGYEILTTGKVNVSRVGIDADELKDIRNGEWSYDQLIAFTTEAEKKLDEVYAKKAYVVPHVPDRNKVNKLCVELVKSRIGVP